MTLAGVMWMLPHMRAAVSGGLVEDTRIKVLDETPDVDDFYVFVEFDRFVTPLKARIWVIGFSGRTLGGTYTKGATVFTHISREPNSNWPSLVRDFRETYKASAVVAMDESVGVALFLYDPEMPIITPGDLFRRAFN